MEDVDTPNPEPTTSTKPEEKLPAKCVTAASQKEIQRANGTAPSVTCQLCNYVCTSRKRLLLHTRLHFVHSFCERGYNSKWRETIRKHQTDTRNNCNTLGPVYEVDSTSFASWRWVLNVLLPSYTGEIPTRVVGPSTTYTAASTSTTSTTTSMPTSTPTSVPISKPTSRSAATPASSSRGEIIHLDTRNPPPAPASAPTHGCRERKHHSGNKSARNRRRSPTACASTTPRDPGHLQSQMIPARSWTNSVTALHTA